MLSLKYIRENSKYVEESLKNKNIDLNIPNLLDLDIKRREYLHKVEELRSEKNRVSAFIANSKKEGGNPANEILSMRILSEKLKDNELKLKNIDCDINKQIYYIPNIVHESVPIGKNESSNLFIRDWGSKPDFTFDPKGHLELGESLQLFDFKRSVKMAGSGFPLYIGSGARLERALINFMLDFHISNHGYIELFPPFLAHSNAMQNTGQLPKFKDDMYQIPEDSLYCIPTAEVPITNMHQGEILLEADLPIKYAAYSACFRREAGSYGKETKGLLRVHQFNKVELVKYVKPEDSYQELELLVENAETILKALGLHYRVIELCSGDLSFSAAKCYDLEVWSPWEKKYLEVSSCSNFENFQSTRANIKFKSSQTGKTRLVHTLNGSGLATPRLMIAIIEAFQQEDGSLIIPEVLRPFMNANKID